MIISAPVPVAGRAFVPVENVGDAVPDVSLVDERGRRLSLRGDRETIVSFAYTRCPDPAMCSLVTAKFARLQSALRDTRIRLVEISLDPAHDRPPVLRAYAAAVGARPAIWSFATGNPQEVVALAERFGVEFDRSHAGAVRHTELVAIVSPEGTIVDRIDGARWAPDDVAAQARADAGLRSNPLRRAALGLFASASAACGGRGGGFTVIAALALFAALAAAFALVTLRLCTSPRLERSRP